MTIQSPTPSLFRPLDSHLFAQNPDLSLPGTPMHVDEATIWQSPPGRIEHNSNPHSCYVAVILNTLRHACFRACFSDDSEITWLPSHEDAENAQALRTLIESCLKKVDQGQTVIVKNVRDIQNALLRCKLLDLDHQDLFQDPQLILGRILNLVAPNLTLFQAEEIHSYNLDQVIPTAETLANEEIVSKGLIIVDQQGCSKTNIVNNTIPLGHGSQNSNLLEILSAYLDDHPSHPVTVYVKQPGDELIYLKYANVNCVHVQRAILEPFPDLLILELADTGISFQQKIKLTSKDGSDHYYALQQVNCHKPGHEYTYIRDQGTWYLSDDMDPPVREVKIEALSPDVNDICSYGRTFIYKGVGIEVFASISDELLTPFPPLPPSLFLLPAYQPSPTKKSALPVPAASESQVELSSPIAEMEDSAVREIVIQQLMGVVEICKTLCDSKLASLQTLLELSWAIGSLPKEKKFSKKWSQVISERQWLLLEDISRQLSLKYPNYPNLSDYYTKESQKIVLEFSPTAEILRNVFATLTKIEQNPSSLISQKPYALTGIERFNSDFDRFVLDQVQENLEIILNSLGTEDPETWLKSSHSHIKAFFRCIEIIGEASKIVSKESKREHPTLMMSSDKKRSLWGQLRNQLHHNPRRSWDIANWAPGKWAKVLIGLFPKLLSEINQYKSGAAASSVSLPTPSSADDLKILDELHQICKQSQFQEVRRIWKGISEDFTSGPETDALLRFLFGFEAIAQHSFTQLWDNYTKHYPDTNKHRDPIFEMYRLGSGNLILEDDIQKLQFQEMLKKSHAVETLKRLLSSISETNHKDENKAILRNFEELANQFVFLRLESKQTKSQRGKGDATQTKGDVARDAGKNETLKSIGSQRLDQIYPFKLSEATFKNQNGSPTEFGQLLEFYIQLKSNQISSSIQRMSKLLIKIQESWPSEVNADNLQSLGSLAKQEDPKSHFLKFFKELQEDEHFVILQSNRPSDEALKKLRVFPASRIANHFRVAKGPAENSKLLNDVIEERKHCHQAVNNLLEFLNQIEHNQSTIKDKVWNLINQAISLSQTEEGINQAEDIFKCFQFKDTKTFIKQLDQAQISHPFNSKSPSLNDLSLKVNRSLKNQLEKDLGAKIDQLVEKADELLCVPYVQNALRLNAIPLSKLPGEGSSAKNHIALLRDIYHAGLGVKQNSEMLIVWKNIERKIDSKRLSAEQFEEVLAWFPSDAAVQLNEKQQKAKNDLKDYLNGCKGFELDHLPRFEHASKKMRTFIDFLTTELFPAFDFLKDQKDKLTSYFKIANKLTGVENKANRFIDHFERKVRKLRIYWEALSSSSSADKRDLQLLSAEYDMQDVGELVQLITTRPSLWREGRHILSSQHLLWIGLMRKMMAHYPLTLAPNILQWNLRYLAFDTSNALSKTGVPSYCIEPVKKPKRVPISYQSMSNKWHDIQDHLDRLNLSLNVDIVYPSFFASFTDHLHPFGELTLLVYPSDLTQSEAEFSHAVMELELILCYELDAKVSVIGDWKGKLFNIPSEKHISNGYLNCIIDKKQSIDSWISSANAYDIYSNMPWSKVFYKSGRVVTRADFELYRDLDSFLKTLGLDRNNLRGFLTQPQYALEHHIKNILVNQLKQAQQNYQESAFFKWVCCLFERFSPPGTDPKSPISFPKLSEKRSLTTMLDMNDEGLLCLPETTDVENSDSNPYYQAGNRLDYVNGRSLLDASKPVQISELDVLAQYAISVLQYHAEDLFRRLEPENGLDRSLFSEISGAMVDDPVLDPLLIAIESIPPEIQAFIGEEAAKLGVEIDKEISRFYQLHGSGFSIQMLNWMRIDKEIEQTMRDYYNVNRVRLKGPYLRMDGVSRQHFDRLFLAGNSEGIPFDFVNCFHQFLNRIHLETYSLKIDDRLQVEGEFSDQFKILVPEADLQISLMVFMKERERIMQLAFSSFLNKYPAIRDPETARKLLNGYYKKWGQLFRMVHSPDLFKTLKNNANQLQTEKRLKTIQNELQRDFEAQYKTPAGEREDSTASTATRTIKLYDVRSYFNGKYATHQAMQEHVSFMERLHSMPESLALQEEQQKLFSEPFQPAYYSNLIIEAREALDTLIRMDQLPDSNFEEVPTYADYWTFVRSNPVHMAATMWGTGSRSSFKQFIKEGGTFQKLIDDPKKREALQQNQRMCNLIKAYTDFFRFEEVIGDLLYNIKFKAEIHIRLSREKQEAEDEGKSEWVSEYSRRFDNVGYGLNRAFLKLEEKLSEVSRTDFFKMLKFWEKRKHVLVDKSAILSEETQFKKALQALIGEGCFSISELADLIDGVNIKPGPLFSIILHQMK